MGYEPDNAMKTSLYNFEDEEVMEPPVPPQYSYTDWNQTKDWTIPNSEPSNNTVKHRSGTSQELLDSMKE